MRCQQGWLARIAVRTRYSRAARLLGTRLQILCGDVSDGQAACFF
jgi:hypothetical protein